MRTLLTTVMILTMTTILAQGKVSTGNMMHAESMRQAAQLEMDVPTDESKDLFSDFMKERYDMKVNSNKDEQDVEQIQLKAISDKTIDLFITYQDDVKEKTTMQLGARQGYDLYFSEEYEPETFEKLKAMMEEFRVYAQEKYFTEVLEEGQKNREDLAKDLEKAKEDVAKNKEDIQKNLKANEEMKSENEKLARTIEELEKKVSESDAEIESTKSTLQKL